ncbi:MAG: hypothetical protein ABIL22_08145 [candidate division WOR-3 bacterium]
MKKLLAVAIAATMLSGLYGLTLSLSGAYQDITDESGGGAYFGAKADIIVGLLPILKARGFLAEVDFSTGTPMKFGTFTGSDLLITIPMAAPVQPYVVAGLWFVKNVSTTIRGGIGAEMGFGNMTGYLEYHLNFVSFSGGGSSTPMNIMGGLRFPLKLGL